MSKPYTPRPLIQIDFPAPRTPQEYDKDNSLSAQVRAMQFFAVMKVTANEVGPDEADKYSMIMTKKLMEYSQPELEQLVKDFDVLQSAVRAAAAAAQGGLLLHMAASMKSRLTDIIEEGQGEDPIDEIDDDEGFIPEIK